MKKYNEASFFFEIQSGPRMSDGHYIRYYVIRCHRCDKTSSYHASGISNEKMRKLFGRQGWNVGKSRNQHVCPECQRKHEFCATMPTVEAHKNLEIDKPPTIVARMRTLWNQCSEEERYEFFCWAEKQIELHIPKFLHETAMQSISTMNEQPTIANAEDTDEPADWWKELND